MVRPGGWMLLFLFAACSNSNDALFGGAESRFDPNDGYVPDTSSGGEESVVDTTDTSDSGGDTDLPETTTEALLLGLTLTWEEDKDGLAYAAGALEYFDEPDDTEGGKLYIEISQEGDVLTSAAYDVVDYDGWDPDLEEAAAAVDSYLLQFEAHTVGTGGEFDTTKAYDFTVMLKDDAGHESADLIATLEAQ